MEKGGDEFLCAMSDWDNLVAESEDQVLQDKEGDVGGEVEAQSNIETLVNSESDSEEDIVEVSHSDSQAIVSLPILPPKIEAGTSKAQEEDEPGLVCPPHITTAVESEQLHRRQLKVDSAGLIDRLRIQLTLKSHLLVPLCRMIVKDKV